MFVIVRLICLEGMCKNTKGTYLSLVKIVMWVSDGSGQSFIQSVSLLVSRHMYCSSCLVFHPRKSKCYSLNVHGALSLWEYIFPRYGNLQLALLSLGKPKIHHFQFMEYLISWDTVNESDQLESRILNLVSPDTLKTLHIMCKTLSFLLSLCLPYYICLCMGHM